MRKTALILVLLLFLTSCSKDQRGNFEYFAFGDAYGFCLGDCANFYMVKEGLIYPDDIERYTGSDLQFKTDPLPFEKYELTKTLIDSFPEYLSDNPDTTFGCPDCADQGGIHIELKEDGEIKRWHFDTNISALPEEIRDYVQKLREVLLQLK